MLFLLFYHRSKQNYQMSFDVGRSIQPKYFLPSLIKGSQSHHWVKERQPQRVEEALALHRRQEGVPTSESKQNLSKSLQSIHELMESSPTKIAHKNFKLEKIKVPHPQEKRELTLEEAQKVYRNGDKRLEQRSRACKVIAESYLSKAFGTELPNLEKDQCRISHQTSLKNKLNTKILSQILNEIQHNSRSHSILIRKSELEQLQAEYLKIKENGKRESSFDKSRGSSEQQKVEALYNIKNQYNILKELIVSTKSEEFERFVARVALQNNSSDLRQTQKGMKDSRGISAMKKTFVLTGIDKENHSIIDPPSSKSIEYSELPKARKNNSINFNLRRFEHSGDRLVLQNFTEISPRVILYLMSHLQYDSLKVIRLKYLWIQSDLIYFMLDCMCSLGSRSGICEVFEISTIKVENVGKMGDRLAKIFAVVPIRSVRLQSLELTNREIAKICESLASSSSVEQVSLRHNKVDILGLRHIETLVRRNSNIKVIDIRNNDIPHYANLKDKSKIIQFF